MSKEQQPASNGDLDREITELEWLLGIMDVGTMDRPRRVRRIVLVAERIQQWPAVQQPSSGERGGTSNDVEASERKEAQRVTAQAKRDEATLTEFMRFLGKVRDLAPRYLNPVDASTLPPPKIPGCRSCARTGIDSGVKVGGHFCASMSPNTERTPDGKTIRGNTEAAELGLCRWCWDHRSATGEFPPIKACDLRHTQGERAAGVWLAKRERGAA